MAITNLPAAERRGNTHDEEIAAELTGLVPVRLRVSAAPELEAVALDIEIRASKWKNAHKLGLLQLVLDQNGAVDLSLRLAGTCERLARRGGHGG